MNPHYGAVAPRAAHRCEYCRAPESVFNFSFEVEHVVPTSRGGPDAGSNLALACRACNLRKGGHVRGTDPESGEEVALFHPREQWWHQHFRVDADAVTIVGTTPTGRATVLRLGMNSPAQLNARRQWVRLRVFP